MKSNIIKVFLFTTLFTTLVYTSITLATSGHTNTNISTPIKSSETTSYLDKTYSKKDLESRIVRLPGETTCFDAKTGVVFNPFNGKTEN